MKILGFPKIVPVKEVKAKGKSPRGTLGSTGVRGNSTP